MKVCSKCKVEKDESEFYKQKKSNDGLQYQCKKCDKERNVINKEKNRIRRLEFRKNNHDSIRKMEMESYRKHSVKKLAYAKSKRDEDPELTKIKAKERYYKNHERSLEFFAKARRNLDDTYVKKSITHNIRIPYSLIPQDLVDFHREVIRAKRLLKELQK